jgi:hypothetical protein
MSVAAVLLPVFVLIALTFVLHYWMGYTRVSSVRRGEVHVRDIALGERNWPSRAVQVGNAFHNQLELPILFFVLVGFALLTRKADVLFVAMSWLFVLLRLLHAYIHVTTNRVTPRFYVHFTASVVLTLMWLIFALRILLEW